MAKLGLLLFGILFACLTFDVGLLVHGKDDQNFACETTKDCSSKLTDSVCFMKKCTCPNAQQPKSGDGIPKCGSVSCRVLQLYDYDCYQKYNWTECSRMWLFEGECICYKKYGVEIKVGGKTLCVHKSFAGYVEPSTVGSANPNEITTPTEGGLFGNLGKWWMVGIGFGVLLLVGLAIASFTLFSGGGGRPKKPGGSSRGGSSRGGSSHGGSSRGSSSGGGSTRSGSSGGGSTRGGSSRGGSSGGGSTRGGSSRGGSSGGGSSPGGSSRGGSSPGGSSRGGASTTKASKKK